jgi:hypothetical protein
VSDPISNHKEIDEYILKSVVWTLGAASAVQISGGDIKAVMEQFPTTLITILVRNNIHLLHKHGAVKFAEK